jgi:formate C-acetyltransferase
MSTQSTGAVPQEGSLSAQELANIQGKSVIRGTVTDRVQRMFEAIRSYGPPRVALERAVYFTESFKATAGQPLVWRWAKALEHVARDISVAIFDDELIVGRPNTWFGRYSLVYPELDGTIIRIDVGVVTWRTRCE